VTVTSQKTFQADDLEDISFSLSPVYLALRLAWDVIFHVHLGWDQGCHPMAPTDAKSTLSLGVQLSLHRITLLRRNMPHISSVGFADYQIAAHGVSHASGCWIKDPFYNQSFSLHKFPNHLLTC